MRSPEEIDRYIRDQYRAGRAPGRIATRLNVRVHVVYARMTAMGIPHPDGSSHVNLYHVHPMWDLPENELRMKIWQRQHDGAAHALRGSV